MSDIEMMQLHTDSTFLGWTNWDTWNANLYLTNDEGVYCAALRLLDEDELRLLFLNHFRDITTINPPLVNWQEIFDSLHEE